MVDVVCAEVFERAQAGGDAAEVVARGGERRALENEERGVGVDGAEEGGAAAGLVWGVCERWLEIGDSGGGGGSVPWLSRRSNLNLGTRASGVSLVSDMVELTQYLWRVV